MNENIINLAIQTAVLLKSAYRKSAELPEKETVLKYFNKLGVNSEDANLVFQRVTEQASTRIEVAEIQSESSDYTDSLCKEINSTLRYSEKICLLLLVQDCLIGMHDIPGFTDHLNQIFRCLGIDSSLIFRFREFLEQDDPEAVFGPDYLLLIPKEKSLDERLEGKWIEDHAPKRKDSSIFQLDEFNHHILVMFVDQIKSYVVRCMAAAGQVFDEETGKQCRFKLLEPGHEITLRGVPVLSYSGLKSRFLQYHEKKELNLVADHIQFRSSSGTKEINTFVTTESTGQLIGIVGKEGVGKSTLLKLLAGKTKPDSGSVYINGYDLWKNKYLLKGTIGYVPEEDLLYEDLTVADNLALTARLYYSNLGKKEQDARVNRILSKLDLLELKHVVVGGLLSKHIQPGQRRMINIALELLREPQILLVDNALSGLGMADASKVIKVLHDYSFLGNLVVTTISQADSNTFRYFDKIWILDEGGRAVYNGPVKTASGYLQKHLNLAYKEIQDVDPSQLLDLVNYKLPDREGQVWKRVMEPKDWHDLYLREKVLQPNIQPAKSILPARILKIPNLEVQLLIFSIRNFKCKFSRSFNIIRTLITGPVIALLVATLLRFSVSDSYTLAANDNLPFYQFFSVVVAVFLGIILSSGEIIRERNMLEKEEYLEFSRFSYLNSKILYLFPVVALQTLLYVLVGNLILGLKDLFWIYWLVLFSCAAFGVLCGLALSSMARNTEVVYNRLIPFFMALQLILGGGLISYDQLNLGTGRYTPILGDMMVSRWGYEALAVEQYTRNRYQRMIYETDKKLSQASFYATQVVPLLERSLTACRNTDIEDSVSFYTGLLQKELNKVAARTDVFPFEYRANLNEIKEDENLYLETVDYLTYLAIYFYEQQESMSEKKKHLLDSLNNSAGTAAFEEILAGYTNNQLEKIVTNANAITDYHIVGHEIIRDKDNIFQEPLSNMGRARLFTPYKLLNDQKTETIWFNISVIWLFSSIFYLLVLFDAGRLFTGISIFRRH